MNKYDDIIKDVNRVYGEMLSATRSCPSGYAEVAAAILTLAVLNAKQEERLHKGNTGPG
jgi:hypothetical protein